VILTGSTWRPFFQWRTEGGVWGFQTPPPPPKFRRPSKIVPNSTRLWKLLKTAEFRTPTPQDVRNKGSKILKLPPVCNCFTFAMTNKLVVIINSLKAPKIKKILLYEMKFLVPNYNCLQNLWLRGYRRQIPILTVLCPQLNLLNPPKQNSWVRHCFLQYVILTMAPHIQTGTCCSKTLQHKESCWEWRLLSPHLYIFIKIGCSTKQQLSVASQLRRQ